MSSDLRKIGALLSYHGAGSLEVTAIGGSYWMRARKAYRLLPPLEHLCWEREPLVQALPVVRAGKYLERVPSALLWAATGSGGAVSRLRTFRPLPSVVIREGVTTRYVAFWALEEPPADLEHALRKIGHHLGGPNKYAGAKQSFTFHLPGTILRAGRQRPLPVELVRYEPEIVTAAQVLGRLREPPDPWTPDRVPLRQGARR